MFPDINGFLPHPSHVPFQREMHKIEWLVASSNLPQGRTRLWAHSFGHVTFVRVNTGRNPACSKFRCETLPG